MRVVAAASILPYVAMGMSMGVEGVTRVTVEAETLMHRDHGAWPAALLLLVDRYVHVGSLRGCALAGVELTSSGQRALGLLCRCTPK